MSRFSNTVWLDQSGAAYAALVLRVSLGVMFVAHAYLKIAVFTLPGTVQFFEAVGFPGWFAYPTVAAELIGGLLLIVGFQTRLVSLALLPVLLGATFVHLGNGWVFSAEGGGYEYPLFLVAAGIAQVLLGDGAHALKLGRKDRTDAAYQPAK